MKKTQTEKAAQRLREKCAAGPDTCGQILAGVLGAETPPLTDLQRDRVLRSAALHFGIRRDCNGCPQALADACEEAPDLADRVARVELANRPKGKGGIVSVLARGVISSRRNPKTPAPPPACSNCARPVPVRASTSEPVELRHGRILCGACGA